MVLEEAGLNFSAIVEMTSYHVGLRDHVASFKRVRDEFVEEPYPAWTAIEVAGFVREGAIVELRAIAKRNVGASSP
jgi:enamine deaminase RidA (YjgF/YER057c/UK114 family)